MRTNEDNTSITVTEKADVILFPISPAIWHVDTVSAI
jgi:hypothetical protein